MCEESTFYPPFERSTVLATFRDPFVDRRDETLADDPDPSISYDRSSPLFPLPRQPDRAWNAHVGIVARGESALEHRASSGWLRKRVLDVLVGRSIRKKKPPIIPQPSLNQPSYLFIRKIQGPFNRASDDPWNERERERFIYSKNSYAKDFLKVIGD